MNIDVKLSKKRKGYIKSSSLIFLAFATAFFPRVLSGVGAPSIINFLHFITIPLACGFALVKPRNRSKSQISFSKAILIGLLVLLGTMTASALLNRAGFINVVLDFILLSEPFILLLAIASIPMSPASLERFRAWVVCCGFTNLIFAFIQRFVLRLHLRTGLEDNIKGVFIGQGAGHVIGASVSMTFSIYYFISAKNRPLWFRLAVLIAAFTHVTIADAKQVLLVFLVALLLLLFTKLKDIGQAVRYLACAIALIGLLNLAANTVLPALKTWARAELISSDSPALQLKLAAFHIIPSYYQSPLNWLLGLGPGHTVGRLGGWMLYEYADLLEPLGSTTHPASKAVWTAVAASWLGNQSSMFSPMFGWAGIWGDLGFLGLGAYLGLSFLVWHFLCKDDFSRFLLLSVFVFGLVFSQMEEPGYMLFVASIIGLRSQENRYRRTKISRSV